MEIKVVGYGGKVYGDFAHHPTAITTTINGLRGSIAEGKIIAVWEPKSATMINGGHKDGIPAALANADAVVAFHYLEKVKWNVEDYVAQSGIENYCYNTVEPLIEKAVELAQPHDHILIMTNGPLGGAHLKIVEGLKAKFKA